MKSIIHASVASWRITLVAACCLSAPAAFAQSADETQRLREEIRALRDTQARIAELGKRNEAAIRALEEKLGVTTPAPKPETPDATLAGMPAPARTSPPPDRLKVSGDIRLRGQHDAASGGKPDRNSSQLRARLGATYAFNERVTVGGRLVSGDADDPNSTDVQLSNWNDDLAVSLDQAYVQLQFGDLTVYGGKFPQPFTRTDLVWDGDVNPQGLAATYRHAFDGGSGMRANALFHVVDENAAGADSTMAGLQLGYDSPSYGRLKFDASGGYYAYRLGSVIGADAGDWRSNRLNADGSFQSDFRLLDLVLGASWRSSSEKWPVRVVADHVRNLGAIDNEDAGFGVDLSIGRASAQGDWRFTYGYARTDVDAVLSAFSQDNIGIATNYRLHAMTVEYTPFPKTALSAIWYHYRPNDPAFAGSNAAGDWQNRFRLYFQASF